MNALKNSPKHSTLALTTLSAVLLPLLFCSAAHADADMDADIENALKFGQADAKYGQIKLDIRLRYDNTDSSAALAAANAMTLRSRIGYLTPEFHGLQGYAEYEGNMILGLTDFNSGRNGKTQYETIGDPHANELNQLWISYKGIPDTEVKIGRQLLNVGNQRFISATAWRQMERTYDGLVITNKSLPNTTVTGGYLLKQQNVNNTVEGMQLPFINVDYKFADIGTLSGYGFWMDFNELHQNSNQTYGVRFDGSRKLNEDLSLLYTAEYAYQQDYRRQGTPAVTPIYSADYYHVVGGVTAYGVTAKAGMEQLGGKGVGRTFDTPIALLHSFNGWADMFTTTPNNGLRDVYGSLNGEVVGVKLIGMYHDFSDDSSQQHFGKEWDFMATKDFGKHYSLFAKYAYFEANTGAPTQQRFPDMQKIWVGANLSF